MQTLTLSHGPLAFTAYANGPLHDERAPLVLCLHGFPDHPLTFRHLLAELPQAGYRVIAPTMRGYEPSSQPRNGDYSIASLAQDVLAWKDLWRDAPLHLVGHDWGAVVGYKVGELAPPGLVSLTTLAVPPVPGFLRALTKHPGQIKNSWYMLFFQLRGIAEWAVMRKDCALLQRLWSRWSPGYQLSKEEWSTRQDTFQAPGVCKAMLSYYRQNANPRSLLTPQHNSIVPVRTLAITGEEDQCIDTRLYDYAFTEEEFPTGYQVKRIPNGGHFVHLEQPQTTTSLLLQWFENRSEPT